jgi:hypothetical protein
LQREQRQKDGRIRDDGRMGHFQYHHGPISAPGVPALRLSFPEMNKPA